MSTFTLRLYYKKCGIIMSKDKMKVIDQTKIYQNYKGQWVILDSRGIKVLSADKELSRAVSKYHQKFGKKEIPLSFKVPTKIMPYIGC